MKLGQHLQFIQTSLHFYFRHEIEKVVGSIKDFMRGDCSTYGALKKFPSMRGDVEDDAYKHYNSGNDYKQHIQVGGRTTREK